MKLRVFLLNSVVIFAFSFLGYGTGKIIGIFFVGDSDPSWSSYSLPTPPKKIDSIVYLQLSSTSKSEDPTGDSLYVRTENGDFYSYTLFQSDWTSVDTDPTRWVNPYVSRCATEWFGPSDFSQLEAYPPVEKDVTDSAGVSFWNYPSTSIARCYTLLNDGNVQGWRYSGNAKDLIRNRLLKKGLNIIGIFLGIILSIIILYKKRKTALATT